MSNQSVAAPGPMEQAILDWRESRVSSATTFKYTHDKPDLLAFAREQDAIRAELLAALERCLLRDAVIEAARGEGALDADTLEQARDAISRAKGGQS